MTASFIRNVRPFSVVSSMKQTLLSLAFLCVAVTGCASHKPDDADSVCQHKNHSKGVHGSFTSSVGHAVGGALPMALGAIPGVGSAAGFAGMGMQQAMNSWGGGGGGPGQQDDGFRQSGFDHSHRGPDEERDFDQSQNKVPSVPCGSEQKIVAQSNDQDIRMDEAK